MYAVRSLPRQAQAKTTTTTAINTNTVSGSKRGETEQQQNNRIITIILSQFLNDCKTNNKFSTVDTNSNNMKPKQIKIISSVPITTTNHINGSSGSIGSNNILEVKKVSKASLGSVGYNFDPFAYNSINDYYIRKNPI